MFDYKSHDWAAWREDPTGYVYFTRFWDATGQSFIKIGRTIQWLPTRMFGVAYDAWKYRGVLFVDWQAMGVMPGLFCDERATQRRFRRHVVEVIRSNGVLGRTEFFYNRPQIARFVERHCAPVPEEARRPDRRFITWRDNRLAAIKHQVARHGWTHISDDGVIQRLLPIGAAAFL